MNYTVKFLVSLICAGVLAPSVFAQGRQVVKGVSALGRIDARVASGVRAVEVARAARVANAAALRTPIRPTVIPAAVDRQEFEKHILRPFTPTPLSELRPRLVSPTAAQMQEATGAYETFFADCSAFRKELDPVLGNALLAGENVQKTLHPSDISYYITRLGDLRLRANSLQNVLFPSDAALKGVREYIDFAMPKFDKFYTPEVSVRARPDRPYVQEEFWMEYDWRKGPRDESLTQLPEDVHMVVLNDTHDILNMYKQWEREGRFPKGWKVSVYEDTKELLDAVKAGIKFDLVISDIQVPGGGGRYFVGQLRDMGFDTPVIGCSMYTRDKIDSRELHQIGFDGYMYGDDMFEESAGFYKWAGYIKNYYYYKRIGNWHR